MRVPEGSQNEPFHLGEAFLFPQNALVVQLDRISDFGSEG